ncbi:hypothetical protein MASR2M18_06490 [Ignavibacteria bacterium]
MLNEPKRQQKMSSVNIGYSSEILFLEDRIDVARQSGEKSRRFVDLLNELSWELRSLDSSRSGSLAEEALAFSKELSYEEGMANALLARGIYRRNTSEYDSALEDLLRARELFYRINRPKGISRSTIWIGLVHLRAGNYAVALKFFLDALQIYEEHEDEDNTAKCYTFIGRAYFNLHDYRTALDYFYKSLHLRESLLDRTAENTIFWDLGRAYLYLGDFGKALEYCERSLSICKQYNDIRSLCGSLYLRGEIYGRKQDASVSIRNFWLSARLAIVNCDKWAEGKAWRAIGEIYTELFSGEMSKPKYFTLAEAYLSDALRVGQEIRANGIMMETHEQLYKLYRNANRLEKALEHFHEFHSIKEAMMTKQSEQVMQNLIYSYEIEKAQKSTEIYRLKNVELANANRELARLNKEKNELLAVVAHDLKNPLAGVAIAVSLIFEHRKSMTNNQLNEQLRMILRTTDSMKELVTKLLDVNALESGKINITYESAAVEPIILELTDEYRSRLNAKKIGIFCSVGNNLELITDKRCLKEILDNLLSNAIKFSPPDRNIFITASDESDTISIGIRDEGPGIPDTDLRKLFTKFSRLTAKPTAGENSTGLGLSIVKKLTELLGGHVRCESVVGKGTTFIITLPVNPTAANKYKFEKEVI